MCVNQIIFSGKIRLVLSPLVQKVPFVAAVNISLLEPPQLTFNVSSLGVPISHFPGFGAWLEQYIASEVCGTYTWPKSYLYPILSLDEETIQKLRTPTKAKAKLRVEVVRAQNLPKMDYIGSCDPYVKLSIGMQHYMTKTIMNCRNPEWRETFWFDLFKEREELSIAAYDFDQMSKDSAIGTQKISISPDQLATEEERVLYLKVLFKVQTTN